MYIYKKKTVLSQRKNIFYDAVQYFIIRSQKFVRWAKLILIYCVPPEYKTEHKTN